VGVAGLGICDVEHESSCGGSGARTERAKKASTRDEASARSPLPALFLRFFFVLFSTRRISFIKKEKDDDIYRALCVGTIGCATLLDGTAPSLSLVFAHTSLSMAYPFHHQYVSHARPRNIESIIFSLI
jgi:hypothetical protein